MLFFHNRIGTHHREEDGKIFSWMALIASTGYSAFLIMLPIVLLEKLGSEVRVSTYFIGIEIVAFITALGSTIILRKISKVIVTKATLAILCVAFLGLASASTIWGFASMDILRVICVTLFSISLGIFVRDFAKEKDIALAEGRFYLFSNMGWVIGPVTGGLITKTFGNEVNFMFTASAYFIVLIMCLYAFFIMKTPHLHHKKESVSAMSVQKNIADFFKQPALVKALIISFGIYFWWAVSAIYIPMAITDLGFGQDTVGLVLSLSMIPVIILEFHVTDGARLHGVKKFFITGYSILIVCLLLFTVVSTSMLIKLMILINIGAAFIEPIKEYYFFQHVKPEDEDRLFGILTAAYPFAYIAAPLMGTLLLKPFGINGIWLFTAAICIIVLLLCLTLAKKKRS